MTPRPDEVLNLPMEDGGTIRDYFIELLTTLWREADGFSGKRPLGDSDWQNGVYMALGKAGLIHLVVDEDGYIEECDDEAGDELIVAAIACL